MIPKNNKYIYEIQEGRATGFFNIYQAKNGGIFIQMGESVTELSQQQVFDLGIHVYSLKDFDLDLYQKHYTCPNLNRWTLITEDNTEIGIIDNPDKLAVILEKAGTHYDTDLSGAELELVFFDTITQVHQYKIQSDTHIDGYVLTIEPTVNRLFDEVN